MDPVTPAPPESRSRGLSALPTSEIQLPPQFVEDIKKIAPKKRRSKGWYVFGAAVLGVGVWLGVSRSARESVLAKIRPSKPQPAPVESVAVEAPVVSVAAPVSAAPSAVPPEIASVAVVTRGPASASASASAKPKKSRRPH